MPQRTYRYLDFITAAFVAVLLISNVASTKIVSLGPLSFDGGTLLFPLAYIFGDILTEVYGYSQARRVIWLGFLCNLFAVVAIYAAQLLPSAGFWDAQPAYERILGYAPRLLLASFAAYLVGEFANSFVLAKLKVATGGRWLWMRTIGSTVVGQGLDSLVFITIAFVGTIPPDAVVQTIVTQWLFKSVYEIIATPLTYVVVNFLKRVERSDVYDTNTDFNPLALSE